MKGRPLGPIAGWLRQRGQLEEELKHHSAEGGLDEFPLRGGSGVGLRYGHVLGILILREDAETIDMRALSGSTGAGIALVIVALLIFWVLGISR